MLWEFYLFGMLFLLLKKKIIFLVFEARERLANSQKTWSWCFLGTAGSVLWNCRIFWWAEYGNLIIHLLSWSSQLFYFNHCYHYCAFYWYVQFVDPVVERLDPKHCIRYRLSKGATKYQNGNHYRVWPIVNFTLFALYYSFHASSKIIAISEFYFLCCSWNSLIIILSFLRISHYLYLEIICDTRRDWEV